LRKKPDTEIKLSDLQEKYLEDRDTDTFQEIYSILIDYARSLTLKKIKGTVVLPADRVQEVAVDAATKIMTRYLKDPDFKIEHSFAGLLKWKVIESLYGDKKEEIHYSLNHIVGKENAHQVELGDIQTTNNLFNEEHIEDFFREHNKKDLVDSIVNINKKVDALTKAPALRIASRLYMLLYLRNPRLRNYEIYFKRFQEDYLTPKEILSLDIPILEKVRLANEYMNDKERSI
jgi:hypothetical protein